jgi:hypothetical protein
VAGSSGIRGGSLGKAIGSSLEKGSSSIRGGSLGKAIGSFLGKENRVSIVEADKEGGFFVLRSFSGLRF